MSADETRSGFVALVGRPNAGKSTLTNAVVGTKVAITSDTPQTTRHRLRAILDRDDAQLVLVDTPGQLEVFAFHASGPKIVSRLADPVGIFIIDAIIGVEDLPAAYLYSLATSYRLGISTLRVVNKVDLLDEGELRRFKEYLQNPRVLARTVRAKGVLADIYLPMLRVLCKVIPAQRVPLVSAKTGEGFDELLTMLYEVKCICGDLT